MNSAKFFRAFFVQNTSHATAYVSTFTEGGLIGIVLAFLADNCQNIITNSKQ